jgi:hypothetical protein
MQWPIGARRQKRKRPQGEYLFQGWIHGLNTSVPASQIASTELAECLNIKINKGGQLETRRPLKKYISGATTSNAAITDFLKCRIGSNLYEIVSDANYKVYRINGSSLTTIGTAIGNIQLMPFKSTCLVLDGSYVKYLKEVAGPSVSMVLAYDAGSGTTGCQFDNKSGEDNGSIALGDGTNNRIATKFTSQTWDTGFTIPITKVYAKLSKTGSPTGDIICKLRAVSDDSVLATKTFKTAASVTGTATEYSVSFTSSDITTEMSQNTAYYCTLEYSGGGVSDYINVHYSDGTGTGYIYTGSWAQATAKDPIMRCEPGRPPKAKFGDVYKHRPFVGGSDTEPGRIYFGALTYLDWSSSDSGGYVGAVDDDAMSFAVGGIINQFGSLFVYGTETTPYLARLEGSSPSEYQVPVLMQKAWTLHKTIEGTPNDIWNASANGVHNIRGVETYGDVRSNSASDPIKNLITDYWSDSSITGYDPTNGHFLLSMPNYHRVLVANINNPVSDPSGQSIRYPWFSYEFYGDDFSNTDNYQWVANGDEYYLQAAAGGDPGLTGKPSFIMMNEKVRTEGTAGSLTQYQWDYAQDPTTSYNTIYIKDSNGTPVETEISVKSIVLPGAFASHDNKFFVCGKDGYIYTYDSANIRELATTRIDYKAKTSFMTVPMGHVNLTKQQLFAIAYGGSYTTVRLRKNNTDSEYVFDYIYNIALSDALTVAEATMSVGDALFLVDRDVFPPWLPMNVDCYSFQAEFRDIIPVANYPLFINGILFAYSKLEK